MVKKADNAVIKKEEKKVQPIDEATKKHLEAQQKIEEAQKILQDQIEKFDRKNQLIQNRKKFLESKESLVEIINKQGVDFDHSLDNEELRIVLESRYNNEELSIKNNFIVREFVEFAIKKIDTKLLEIEKEILAS